MTLTDVNITTMERIYEKFEPLKEHSKRCTYLKETLLLGNELNASPILRSGIREPVGICYCRNLHHAVRYVLHTELSRLLIVASGILVRPSSVAGLCQDLDRAVVTQ